MPGPAIATSAIVVGAVRYGESSRIVRLATRDLGLQSAIAKGVSRPRSPFGALQLLAEGMAHLIAGRGELATLTGFDLADSHGGVAQKMDAFRAASALAELAARTMPQAESPELFNALQRGIRVIEVAPAAAAEVAALSAFWRFVAALGHAPTLESCARDGRPIVGRGSAFSVEEGGAVCPQCAAGGALTRLKPGDIDALEFFVTGTGQPPCLDQRHAAAHRRLLVRWIGRHLDGGPLPALGQWLSGDDSTPDRA